MCGVPLASGTSGPITVHSSAAHQRTARHSIERKCESEHIGTATYTFYVETYQIRCVVLDWRSRSPDPV